MLNKKHLLFLHDLGELWHDFCQSEAYGSLEFGASDLPFAVQSLVAGLSGQELSLCVSLPDEPRSACSNQSFCLFTQGQGGRMLKLALGWPLKILPIRLTYGRHPSRARPPVISFLNPSLRQNSFSQQHTTVRILLLVCGRPLGNGDVILQAPLCSFLFVTFCRALTAVVTIIYPLVSPPARCFCRDTVLLISAL